MKSPQLVLVALAAAGAGFAVGRFTASSPLEESRTEAVSAPEAAAHSPGALPVLPATADGKKSGKAGTEELKAQALLLGAGTMDNADLAKSWADFYAKLENADIPSLAQALASEKNDKLDNGVRAVYAAWAGKDPAAAWRSALSFSEGGKCNGAMHAVLDTVGKKDPSAALAMAQGIENPELKAHMSSSALQALARTDPSRAFEMALRSAERGDNSAFYSVLSQWVQNDPSGAQRAVAGLPGELGDQARVAVVQNLAQKDPEAAWNYAVRLPPSGERFSYWDPRIQVIERWAKTDPRRAMEAALTLGDQQTRNRAVAEAVDTWASSDAKAALTYASSLKDAGLRGSVLSALARNSNTEPATMFEVLLDQAPAGDSFGNALSSLMSRWARSNPREAAAAALQLPAGDALVSSVRNIASEWTSTAPDKNEVLSWVGQLPQGRARSEAMESVFQIWSSRDPGGAQRAWSVLGAKDKEEIFSSITEGWSRTQPADAARWAVSMADQPGGSQALQRAISAWSRSAPTEAAAFVQNAPENVRPGLTSQLIERWYSDDPFAAAEWLKQQPAGPAKDAGVMAMASEISGENPQTALDWTKSIADQSNRDTQVGNILRQWMRNDSVAASAWIRTAPLPAETKAELLQRAP